MALQLRPSWRPVSLRLGQPALQALKIVVVDANGRPIPDAEVGLPGRQVEKTDWHGTSVFEGVTGAVEVRVTYKDLTIARRLSADEATNGTTQFLQFQICVADPIIRPVDLVIVGGATALILAGSYYKVKPLSTVGEITIGAAIFSFIYRLQCL